MVTVIPYSDYYRVGVGGPPKPYPTSYNASFIRCRVHELFNEVVFVEP